MGKYLDQVGEDLSQARDSVESAVSEKSLGPYDPSRFDAEGNLKKLKKDFT